MAISKSTPVTLTIGSIIAIIAGTWAFAKYQQDQKSAQEKTENDLANAIVSASGNISNIYTELGKLQENLDKMVAKQDEMNQVQAEHGVFKERFSSIDKFIETATPSIHNNTARSLTNTAKLQVMK